MKIMSAPCSSCLRATQHNVLFTVEEPFYPDFFRHELLQCAGCKEIIYRRQYGPDEDCCGFYPPPTSRRAPLWVYYLSTGKLAGDVARSQGDLLEEIYRSLWGEQPRLALMGVRALIEEVMISRTGDHGTFAKNLDAFHQQGYVSLIQRDALVDILDAGHAAMHRAFTPKREDIEIALDIAEGVLAAIYVHGGEAKRLAARVPARQSPNKRPKDH